MECASGSVLGYFCHEDADKELIYRNGDFIV
jgi:hypothetical protein